MEKLHKVSYYLSNTIMRAFQCIWKVGILQRMDR